MIYLKESKKKPADVSMQRGGIGFHRGFYSPSQMDLVVWGVNRGRLLKRGKNGKESYEYLFDNDNELICVYDYGYHDDRFLPSIELFVRDNDVVQSFDYEFNYIPGQKGLEHITEVIKEDGKIREYRWTTFNVFTNECDWVEVEKYDYNDDRIQSIHYYEYDTYRSPSMPSLSHDKYTLFWDENGKIQALKTEYLTLFPENLKWKTKLDTEGVDFGQKMTYFRK